VIPKEPQIGIEPMTAPSNGYAEIAIWARCCNLARALRAQVSPKRTQKRLQSCNEVATTLTRPFPRPFATPGDMPVHLQLLVWRNLA